MKKTILLITMLLVLVLASCETNKETGSSVGDRVYNIAVEASNGDTVHIDDFNGKTIFLLAWTST